MVVLDEPTEGLDDDAAATLLARLRDHYRDGVSMIISHQDAQRVPGARRWRLEDGVVSEFDGGLANGSLTRARTLEPSHFEGVE